MVEHLKWEMYQRKIYRYTLSATGVSTESPFNFGWSENGSQRAYSCIWIHLQLGGKLLFQSLSKRHWSREWKWKRTEAISSLRERKGSRKQQVNIPQLTRTAWFLLQKRVRQPVQIATDKKVKPVAGGQAVSAGLKPTGSHCGFRRDNTSSRVGRRSALVSPRGDAVPGSRLISMSKKHCGRSCTPMAARPRGARLSTCPQTHTEKRSAPSAESPWAHREGALLLEPIYLF